MKQKRMILIAVLCLMLAGCGAPEEAVSSLRIGSMKGPTSMGLLHLKEEARTGTAQGQYEFTMTTGADELLPLMVKGELDIALVPANVAAVLYQKTKGQVAVININTLGVLYLVSGDDSLENVSELSGRTIYLTGKGTTPDYVLRYILSQNGILENCRLEYRSEPAEVAALLSEDTKAVGLLPQPFVTAACMQNEALKPVLDLDEEWNSLQGEEGSMLVTGVTIARREVLTSKPEAIALFLQEHKESAEAANADVETTAALAVSEGIIAKEPAAQKAIPECNITYIDAEQMKRALSGYLQVLWEQDPAAVGGALPEDDFYYVP